MSPGISCNRRIHLDRPQISVMNDYCNDTTYVVLCLFCNLLLKNFCIHKNSCNHICPVDIFWRNYGFWELLIWPQILLWALRLLHPRQNQIVVLFSFSGRHLEEWQLFAWRLSLILSVNEKEISSCTNQQKTKSNAKPPTFACFQSSCEWSYRSSSSLPESSEPVFSWSVSFLIVICWNQMKIIHLFALAHEIYEDKVFSAIKRGICDQLLCNFLRFLNKVNPTRISIWG